MAESEWTGMTGATSTTGRGGEPQLVTGAASDAGMDGREGARAGVGLPHDVVGPNAAPRCDSGVELRSDGLRAHREAEEPPRACCWVGRAESTDGAREGESMLPAGDAGRSAGWRWTV